MNGFFYDEKEKKKKFKKKNNKITEYTCSSCGLNEQCESPKMKPSGSGKLNILVVAEAPGKKEDQTGTQLVGESGQELRKHLKNLGYSLDEDFWKTNAVTCRPPGNRKPTIKEIRCCNPNLMKFIKEKKPDKIIALGGTAFQSLTGETGIEKWNGYAIPDQKLGCWIYPLNHPSFLIRNKNDDLLKKQFKSGLKFAIEDDREFPVYSDIEEFVEVLNSPFEAIIFMQGILDGTITANDIETTGKAPYKKGHEIICVSIAVSVNRVVVFPFFKDKEFRKEFKKFLKNKKIKKIAHNMKFEDKWYRVILKTKTKGWYWDTMIGAHIADNRRGITGLKDQVYINYGIRGYDDEISPFFESGDKSSHAFNRIKECDLRKLMIYCGLDSLFSLCLYKEQEKNMSAIDFVSYDLLHQGVLEFCEIEQNGICVNTEYYNKAVNHVTKKMDKIEKDIMNSKEVGKWDGRKEFKFTSNKDLPHLLFDILNIQSIIKTKKGNKSVSGEALEKIKYPFVKKIVKWRKLKKIRDTYLQGYIRENVNGKMYPSFHLNTTVTYRPSCSNPNFANIPKHEERAKKYTRKGIIPSPGRQLAEVDYSQIEVRIGACYHKDPAMIKYIKDTSTDMHRDQAMELFLLKENEITKEHRQLSKNKFVFPQFYGDWWKSCAEAIWKDLDNETKIHLKKNGVNGLGRLIIKNGKILDCTGFYKHVQKVEKKLWNEKFPVYNQWRNDNWKAYQKTGTIKTLSNFELIKKMDRKDASNYPIQGSAFHCLLLSMIYINKYLRKYKFKTNIIGQIYDSIVFDMCPEEKEKLKPVIRYVMTKKIKKMFPWIIVPLEIEMEVSEIDGNWYEMHEEKI